MTNQLADADLTPPGVESADADEVDGSVEPTAASAPWRAQLRQLAPWSLPILVILFMTAPLTLTNQTFGIDWANHLYLISVQSDSIAETGIPTYFINTASGVFNPYYAFYGGTIYVVTGAIGALLGAQFAFVLMTIAGFAMAYLGVTWLAVQFGLRRWVAQLPGLVLVLSPYTITNAYARGAWTEFMATSAMPLVAASAVWLFRSRRWKALPVLALIFSSLIWSGTHLITLVYGSALFAGLLVLCAIANFRSLRKLPVRRIVGIAAIVGLTVGVNAWFFVPIAAFSKSTMLAASLSTFPELPELSWLLRIGPDGFPGSTTPMLSLALPVLVLLWCLFFVPESWIRGQLGKRSKVLVVGLLVLLVGLTFAMLSAWVWQVLPQVLRVIQWTYRISGYLLMVIALLVGVLLLAKMTAKTRRSRLIAVVTLGAALAITGIISTIQMLLVPNTSVIPPGDEATPLASGWQSGDSGREWVTQNINETPFRFYGLVAYWNLDGPILTRGLERQIKLDPAYVTANQFVGDFTVQPGTHFVQTNIATGTYLVDVTGASVAGRSPDGRMVLEVPPGSDNIHLDVKLASSPVIVWSQRVTFLCIAALIVIVAVIAVRGRRKPKAGEIPAT